MFAVYLRVPARMILLACLAAFLADAVWPSVTVGVLAGVMLLCGVVALISLDAASRRGRSAARRWRR
jgi:hypothetical protein